jgi:hypothetical protein
VKQINIDRLDNARHWGFVTNTKTPVCYEIRIQCDNGGHFTLLREAHHTDVDMNAAKRMLHWVDDVVAIKEEIMK